MARLSFGLWLLLAGVAACGGGDDDDDDDDVIDPEPLDGACAADERVGRFAASLELGLAGPDDDYTNVQGQVFDSVLPRQVGEVVDTAGNCRLMQPPELFCDPPCEVGFTCAATGACVASPVAVSVGTVTVDGLADPVELTPGPTFLYRNLGDLAHPGFDEGDDIVLRASGDGAVAPFALGGVGVSLLTIDGTSVPLESGTTTAAAWTAPGPDAASEIVAVLNIAQHGGTPGWIECVADDTGQIELPQALTDQLLDFGYSGFPTLSITRRTADSTTTSLGCVEFLVSSSAVFDVEIPGLTSCSGDEDCTPPETCQGDLTCG